MARRRVSMTSPESPEKPRKARRDLGKPREVHRVQEIRTGKFVPLAGNQAGRLH